MKSRVSFVNLGLLFVLFLAACGTQSPTQNPAPTSAPAQPPTAAPTTAPTAAPEPTTPPPTPTAIPVPTLPPAEATITCEGTFCTYEGPQPIPAQETFTVNWYVNSTTCEEFGLLVFLVSEEQTKEDVVAAFKREGEPPAWLTQAGSFFTKPNSSLQVTVQTADGLLFGPLYFICSTPERILTVIGPIEVE